MNVEAYLHSEEFTIREAAFLWTETEPTESEMSNLPLPVKKMGDVLIKEVRLVKLAYFKDLLRDIIADGKVPPYIKEWRVKCHKRGAKWLSEDVEAAVSEGELDLFFVQCCEYKAEFLKPEIDDTCRRDELIKIAEKLNDYPKFLFPPNPKKSDPRETVTELTVILGLLKDKAIDPYSPNANGKIRQQLEAKGLSIDPKTMRKLLDKLKKDWDKSSKE